MYPGAQNATAATRIRLLITAFILAGLLLAAGVACGGGDDANESIASSGDVNPGQSRSGGDPAPALLSTQHLGAVPNVEFRWVSMVDVGALLAGHAPREIMALFGHRGVDADNWTDIELTQGWRELFGISITDVDVGIHLSSEPGEAYALQGSFDPAAVESALNSSEEFEAVEAEGIDYAAWESDEDTAAIIENRVYVVNEELEDARESFLDPVAQADSLLKYPESPFVKALEKVGTGWLLAAWDGPWYCDYFDLSGCLAMALAASTGDDSTIEANWAILFDSEEAARTAGQVALEEIAESWMVRSVVEAGPEFKVETDGEFVIIEVSVSAETAAEFLDMLLDEGPLNEGPLRR